MFAGTAFANNLAITNVSLASQDTGGHTYNIKFDTSWDNSSYISGAPSSTANWDTAWIFVKFRKLINGVWGSWGHCTLLNSGNTVPSGAAMDFGITMSAYKGIFLYRSSAGNGSNSFTNAQIVMKAMRGMGGGQLVKLDGCGGLWSLGGPASSAGTGI